MRAFLQRTRRAHTVAHRCRSVTGSLAAIHCRATALRTPTTTTLRSVPRRTAALRRTSTETATKKEKPPSFHSEKGSVKENIKATATRNSETLPALNDLVGLADFGLITVQWLMDDVLVLRSLGLAWVPRWSSLTLCRKPPVMLPVYFNVLFIAVNGYFIARIVDERRDIELRMAARMGAVGFGTLRLGPPAEGGAGFGRGRRRRVVAAGRDSLSGRRAARNRVAVVLEGELSVDAKGEHLAEIPVGDCVGEFGYVKKKR